MSSNLRFAVPYRVALARGTLISQVRLSLSVESKIGTSTLVEDCVLDSGAVFTTFSEDAARALGIEIESGERETVQGISHVAEVWLHEVRLRGPGFSLSIRAAFQRGLPVNGLLGMNGFMEHFRITFDGPRRVCEFERKSAG